MKTVIIGATPNTERYAWLAANMLNDYNFEFVPVGIKRGEVMGKPIQNIKDQPAIKGVHTVTLYIGPHHQPEYYDYIFSLNPQRIIFNPGTENDKFMEVAQAKGIETVVGCTLVMLRSKTY
ncbi:CoA-binding protein [Xanthovirga aplysinae]|uniref:CoA-binding protein n=1 Tax=Xanthovirga aplysinae TaxID=2529853 RepID=UPI0012BBBDD1|nr:CoA-binding protein [Xanthovirga aplysinae]MTI32758.1 CoA-binding protein [Xanthovirga aplysinae]